MSKRKKNYENDEFVKKILESEENDNDGEGEEEEESYQDKNPDVSIDSLSNSIKIKPLDTNLLHPYNIKDPNGSRISVVGAPGTGKSVTALGIAESKKHFIPAAQIFHGPEAEDPFYTKYFPHPMVFEEVTEKITEDYVQRQILAKKHLSNPWCLRILDDVIDDAKVLNKPIFKKLQKKIRHWNGVEIIATQYSMDLQPLVRKCQDYNFLLPEGRVGELKKLYVNYASCIPDFQLFCDLMGKIAENHTALVLFNTSNSNKMEDKIFYYKTPERVIKNKWRFGSENYWNFCNERFDKQHMLNN